MLSDLHYQILKAVSEYNLASKNFISGNDLAAMFHDDIFLTDDPIKFLIDSGYLEYSPAQNAKTYYKSDEPRLKKEKQLKYDYDPCYHLRLTNTGRAVLDECSENNRKLSILERELAELSKLNETHKHLVELADKRIATLEADSFSLKSQADSLKQLANSAAEQAESAKADTKFSKRVSIVSICASVIATLLAAVLPFLLTR